MEETETIVYMLRGGHPTFCVTHRFLRVCEPKIGPKRPQHLYVVSLSQRYDRVGCLLPTATQRRPNGELKYYTSNIIPNVYNERPTAGQRDPTEHPTLHNFVVAQDHPTAFGGAYITPPRVG